MKYTNETFIKKATEKYGNKYTYDKVNYINSQTKVCIICPEHGEFYIRPADYLRGYGCPKCSNIKRIKNLGNDIQFDPKSKILTVMTVFFCLHTIYNKITKIYMNKNMIRLTESQLHRVIKESVKKVLKEDLYHTYGVEFTPNEALRQFKINMYDYLDCPTIGGGFRLRNDMKSIKNHFPQINLIEIISQILNEYQPNEDYTYEDGQFEYVKDNLINFAKTLN